MVEYKKVLCRTDISLEDVKKIVDEGNVGVLMVQSTVTEEVKSILDDAGITLYENINQKEIRRIRERIRSDIII